jgi:hypothetical protein
MKIIRGDYPGASRFAYFDTPLEALNPEQLRALLQAILHRAMPGETNHELMMHELKIAEQCWKEQQQQ